MILEFDSCHLDFDDEMSNYKTDQPLVRYMSNSWSFFRARVDQLHMSYNASYISLSVRNSTRHSPCLLSPSIQLPLCYDADEIQQFLERTCLSICRATNTSKTFDKQTRTLLSLKTWPGYLPLGTTKPQKSSTSQEILSLQKYG
jgi:hypothetical protein